MTFHVLHWLTASHGGVHTSCNFVNIENVSVTNYFFFALYFVFLFLFANKACMNRITTKGFGFVDAPFYKVTSFVAELSPPSLFSFQNIIRFSSRAINFAQQVRPLCCKTTTPTTTRRYLSSTTSTYYNMPRILVYGGRGALGSAVVTAFNAKGWETVSVDFSDSNIATHSVVIKGSQKEDVLKIIDQLKQKNAAGKFIMHYS